MIDKSWEFGKAIRPLFTEPVKYKAEILSVCHADNLPGTADIDISTA